MEDQSNQKKRKYEQLDANGQNGEKQTDIDIQTDTGTSQDRVSSPIPVQSSGQPKVLIKRQGHECPYLDTIARQRLDFDFEKCCSVSLRQDNCYACLVCGKYFQGRGKNTHAYVHSLAVSHFMFMNLQSGRVYCLPDGYEVIDRSLDDIRRVLKPSYSKEQIAKIDSESNWKRALDGQEFLPGTVGLNNIKCTDYANVVIQALFRVRPLRNFLLDVQNCDENASKSKLVQKFGELCRKMWNPEAFKGQVSPLEFLLAVQERSKLKFKVDSQSDPVEFLSWLLNMLHFDLTRGKPKRQSIITKCFQGELVLSTLKGDMDTEDKTVPFLMLGLDLPPTPLFRDAFEKNIIPQVPLIVLMKKYDGSTIHEKIQTGRHRYRITRLPKYLIVWIKRFTKNNFFKEKNPTIVTFPVKNLELADHIPIPENSPSKYNLIANICHEGKPDDGQYKGHLYHYADDEWYEVEDLNVTEVRSELVAISETYAQIYEMKQK